MCGIAGFLEDNARTEIPGLARMLGAIRHRGPDQFGAFADDHAALGSARLSINDIAGGLQPSVTPDRGLAVVFNGEIFNFRDIRRELEGKGVRFETQSEVETLRWMYAIHGTGMFRRLNGQFAIAVWDAPRKRLVLARDRFGIRPLFWRAMGRSLDFASEIKALFAKGGSFSLDHTALRQTMRFWTVAGERTAFEGVRQLPPGCFMVVEGGERTITRYWDWPFAEVEEIRLGSDAEYVELFRQELDRSVRRQKMADVAVGSYLSGGIDSSSVAALLQMQDKGGLKTYSVAFEDPEYDESAAQRLMAETFGFRHQTVTVGGDDIAKVFPEVVWHAEAALFRSAPAPLFLLARAVHQDGLKVVMTGEGSDEILLGYDLFREIAIRQFWARQPQSAWRGALFRKLYAYLPQYRNPRYLGMLLDFYRGTLDEPEDKFFGMRVRWRNGEGIDAYVSPEVLNASDPTAELDAWLYPGFDAADHIGRAQSVEMQTLLANYLLSSQGDRMSMAHAVEGRYPFLDNEFVDFALRLPRRLKLRGLKDKDILRRSMADILPQSICHRPKVAYQAPDVAAFVNQGKLDPLAEDLLSPARIAEHGLFNAQAVQQLLVKVRQFQLPRIGMRDNMAFIFMMSVGLLEETFVRRRISFAQEAVPVDQIRIV